MISRYKTGKHFAVTITETTLAVTRRQDQIDAEAALDGFYVLRTPVPADALDAPGRGDRLQEPQIRGAGLPARSSPTTWTCGPCSTGWKNGSGPTC